MWNSAARLSTAIRERSGGGAAPSAKVGSSTCCRAEYRSLPIRCATLAAVVAAVAFLRVSPILAAGIDDHPFLGNPSVRVTGFDPAVVARMRSEGALPNHLESQIQQLEQNANGNYQKPADVLSQPVVGPREIDKGTCGPEAACGAMKSLNEQENLGRQLQGKKPMPDVTIDQVLGKLDWQNRQENGPTMGDLSKTIKGFAGFNADDHFTNMNKAIDHIKEVTGRIYDSAPVLVRIPGHVVVVKQIVTDSNGAEWVRVRDPAGFTYDVPLNLFKGVATAGNGSPLRIGYVVPKLDPENPGSNKVIKEGQGDGGGGVKSQLTGKDGNNSNKNPNGEDPREPLINWHCDDW
jgi:hypothetical protein